MIAVMGAAGNVGSKVAEALLEAGEEVRALQHGRDLTDLKERGAEVVAGDAMSVDDLTRSFDGAVAALVLLPENVADRSFVENRKVMSHAIRDALRASGVGHVVALSAVGAALEDAPGPPGGLHRFERDLAELGTNVLVLRSAAYMDYLLAAVPMIQAEKVNGSAVKADVRFPAVATNDVAREAAARLRRCDFSGHEVKLLLGPEDITMAAATKAIGARLGMPDVPYVEFPPDGVKASLVGAGMSEEVAGLIVDMQLGLNERRYFEGVRRTPESTTPTRLEDFLETAMPAKDTDGNGWASRAERSRRGLSSRFALGSVVPCCDPGRRDTRRRDGSGTARSIGVRPSSRAVQARTTSSRPFASPVTESCSCRSTEEGTR